MVTEDDAQNGPDHVDAHRTLAQVISPYTRTGRVDSTFYSTSSMLRTMELLVGLGPLTQFDAYAAPLAGAFTTRSDTTPYTALVPRTPKEERNTAASPLAAQSATQDTTVEDAIDEQTFNQAVWQSVRGANSPMPAPRYTLRGAAGTPAPAAQQGGDPDDKQHSGPRAVPARSRWPNAGLLFRHGRPTSRPAPCRTVVVGPGARPHPHNRPAPRGNTMVGAPGLLTWRADIRFQQGRTRYDP
jgi:hypothetical protein